jgi:lysophospholipase L1-like esterase
MKIVRIIGINLIVLVLLLGVAEIAARMLYPEFQGDIHSAAKTQGVTFELSMLHGIRIRVPYAGARVDTSRPLIVILGDSISIGYGTPYEDIYWVRMERLLNLNSQSPTTAVALAGYGNNLADSARALRQLSAASGVRLRTVIYQFNFNDVSPFNRAALHGTHAEGAVGTDIFRTIARWRYEYLNHSVLFRVVQHYGGMMARRRTGSCEERGLDALGPYTWTYGSRAFKGEAERYWRQFEAELADVSKTTRELGADFVIFVSPLVFDVDREHRHPYFNYLRHDFGCATIEPRARLRAVADQLRIEILDPAEYVRRGYEMRLKEGNFTPFFFTADENHFTPTTASYIAEYLAAGLNHALARQRWWQSDLNQ